MSDRSSDRKELKKTRYRLRSLIKRTTALYLRCVGQTCDGDLRMVDRESAEKRARICAKTLDELKRSVNAIDEALKP